MSQVKVEMPVEVFINICIYGSVAAILLSWDCWSGRISFSRCERKVNRYSVWFWSIDCKTSHSYFIVIEL